MSELFVMIYEFNLIVKKMWFKKAFTFPCSTVKQRKMASCLGENQYFLYQVVFAKNTFTRYKETNGLIICKCY